MNRLIDLFAPRGRLDFALKVAAFLLAIGAMNWLRDLLQSGAGNKGFLINLRDSTFVGLPFVIFALLLIGHLARLQHQLARLAATDMLTGLPNRRAFLDRIADGPVLRESGTFLMVDLDHFKRINDTFGHQAGDLCLRAAADFIKVAVGDPVTCARLGGEEFGLFVPAASGPADLLAGRLAAGLTVRSATATDVRLTMSVGIAAAQEGTELALMMSRADQALYQAKADGRARSVRWTANLADADRRPAA